MKCTQLRFFLLEPRAPQVWPEPRVVVATPGRHSQKPYLDPLFPPHLMRTDAKLEVASCLRAGRDRKAILSYSPSFWCEMLVCL